VPVVTASFRFAEMSAKADSVSSAEADLVAEAVNQPPVAAAGEAQSVTDDDGDGFADVTLDGSGSADPDGTIVKYLWSLDGTWLSDQAVATVKLPVGTLKVQLTVTDNSGDSANDTVRIEVIAGATKPAPEPTTPPLPPAPFQVEAKQKLTEVAITWQVLPDSVPPYHVYRCVDDGTLDNGLEHTAEEIDAFNWVLIREEYDKLSYRDADVQVGEKYLYSVKAFDGTNESERSNIARITVQAVEDPPTETPPPPPENTVPADTPTPIPDTPTPEPPPDTPTPGVDTSSDSPTETVES
jgi:hypothetical protein